MSPDDRQRLGVDRDDVRAVSRFRDRSLQGVLAALVRDPEGPARRLLGHPGAALAQPLPQLLHAGPSRHLRGLSHLRALAVPISLPAARVAALTALALLCFAANSLLCRAALGSGAIDPARFTAVRLGCGAVLLAVLTGGRLRGAWRSAAALLLYAVAFSFAYVRLPAGVGALILFGSVQITMVGTGVVRRQRPRLHAFARPLLALVRLVALAMPSARSATLLASLSMSAAGAAWGAVSLFARQTGSALVGSAGQLCSHTPVP